MASSLNQCQFIGNLGGDPESRYLPSGDAISNFTIACTEKWKDKQSGETKESTEWVRCSVFGKLAEICNEYLKKGAKVFIQGKFKTRAYEKDGTTRYTTEIKVEQMIMLGGSQGSGEGGGERRERTSEPRQQRQPAERQGTKAGSAGSGSRQQGGGFDEMDDDIPFAPPFRGLQWLCCA